MATAVVRPLLSFGDSIVAYGNAQPPMTVRVKKDFPTANTLKKFRQPGVFYGARYYTHADGPFEVEADRAKAMLKEGVVDAVARLAVTEAEHR